MADEYVRREILDLYIERMEAISEKNLAKHDAIAAEMRANISEMKGDLKAMNARLDTIENKFSWNLAWVGIIIGLALAIVQLIWK